MYVLTENNTKNFAFHTFYNVEIKLENCPEKGQNIGFPWAPRIQFNP